MKNIGLIGCGARISSVLSKIPRLGKEFMVKGIYDPSPESVEKICNQFNLNTNVYNSYSELVKDPELDWVFIGSWNCFHREHAIAAAEAGKNIFCEKPLATNLEDCLAIHEAVKKSGVKFIIGFTLRYSPHYNKIKKMVEEGAIGKIISMEFNETLDFNHAGYIMGDWRRLTKNAGSHLLEKCCHDLDLTNWLVESLASKVASFGGLNFYLPENRKRIDEVGVDHAGRPAYMAYQRAYDRKGPYTNANPFTADKDIVDNQVAIIEYDNGVRATFHTNCNSAIPERRMCILGTEGTLRADLMAGKIEYKKIGFDSLIEDVSADVRGGHGGGDEVLGREILDAMLIGTAPRSSLEDGLISAITAFGIDKAMKTSQVVDMGEYWKKAGVIS